MLDRIGRAFVGWCVEGRLPWWADLAVPAFCLAAGLAIVGAIALLRWLVVLCWN